MHLVTSLDRTRPTRRQWRDWQNREQVLVSLSYDTARVRLHQRGNECRSMQDRLLAAFVRTARHDNYATQVIASCLRPALNARVRRYHRGLGRDEAWTILLASLCQRIDRYDTTRQPHYRSKEIWRPAIRIQVQLDSLINQALLPAFSCAF